MSGVWIFYVITALSVFNTDLVIGQTNNVLSGAQFNITIAFKQDIRIFWLRNGVNLRDARVNTTTGYGCQTSSFNPGLRFNFYCEGNGTIYKLELDSSAEDQGIIYTADPPTKNIQYAVIDQNHTAAITYHIPSELKDSININCTVACTPSDTSITVYVKQNDTEYLLGTPTPERENCSTIDFQTITVSATVTSQFVQSYNISKNFTIVFWISYGGKHITIETSAIEVVPDPTTTPKENTTVAQSSISHTSTSGATTSSDSSSSTPLSSSSLSSTSQQVVTNNASIVPNTPTPGLSDEMLAVIIASSVVGFSLLVVIIFFIACCVVIRKRKRNSKKAKHPGEDSHSNKGYNYYRRSDIHPSESKHHSRHTPRQMNIAEFQRPDHPRGPAVTRSPYGRYSDYQLYNYPYGHYLDYQLYNYPSKSKNKPSSRNNPSKHTTSSRHDPRSDKYRDPNKNYNYVDENRDFNQEYYIRPYAGGYPSRSGDYRYYR